MLLYVYRLRHFGIRQGRLAMVNEGVRGEFRMEPMEVGWGGRKMMLASLCTPGTQADIIPRLEEAKVLRVRLAMLIAGIEAVPHGRKGVERYRQTWVCAAEPIPVEQWPDRQAARSSSGFDPADDDYA